MATVPTEMTFVSQVFAPIGERFQAVAGDQGSRWTISGAVAEPHPGDGDRRRIDIMLVAVDGAGGVMEVCNGEVKRPEAASVNDPGLRADARSKSVEAGTALYFVWNLAWLRAWVRGSSADDDEVFFDEQICGVAHSSQLGDAAVEEMVRNFVFDKFVPRVEAVLAAKDAREQPPVATVSDVRILRQSVRDVMTSTARDVEVFLAEHPEALDEVREAALREFGFSVDLDVSNPADMLDEIKEITSQVIFDLALLLILYRMLRNVYPLDDVLFAEHDTPRSIQSKFEEMRVSVQVHAPRFSHLFAVVPLESLVFVRKSSPRRKQNRWADLQRSIEEVSWDSLPTIVGSVFEAVSDVEHRRLLGQFYTPPVLCDVLAAAAVRSPGDRVMDPSTGGGSPLLAVSRRKRWFRKPDTDIADEMFGVDISAHACRLAATVLTVQHLDSLTAPKVHNGNFLQMRPGVPILCIDGSAVNPGELDGIVGNPPWIRRHRMTGEALEAAQQAEATNPLVGTRYRLDGQSDTCAWFVQHAVQFLKPATGDSPGGRLAFIVNPGLLSADYSISLQRFLGATCRIVTVAVSNVEQWFADASTNAALLIVERCDDPVARHENLINFVQLNRKIGDLFGSSVNDRYLADVDEFVRDITSPTPNLSDPRYTVTQVQQGHQGGLWFTSRMQPGRAVPTTDTEPDHRWNVHLKRTDTYRGLMDDVLCTETVVPLGNVADVTQGGRTGEDGFCLLRDVTEGHLPTMLTNPSLTRVTPKSSSDEFEIERAALRPAARVSSLTAPRQVDIDGWRVFAPSVPPASLAASMPCAARYMQGRRWPTPPAPSNGPRIVILAVYDYGYPASVLEDPDVVMVYGNIVTPRNPDDTDVLIAVMNSPFFWCQVETHGQNLLGGGALTLQTPQVKKLLVPDPQRLTRTQRETILAAFEPIQHRPFPEFNTITDRPPAPPHHRLWPQEWEDLHLAVLQACGAPDPKHASDVISDQLRHLIQFRQQRAAVPTNPTTSVTKRRSGARTRKEATIDDYADRIARVVPPPPNPEQFRSEDTTLRNLQTTLKITPPPPGTVGEIQISESLFHPGAVMVDDHVVAETTDRAQATYVINVIRHNKTQPSVTLPDASELDGINTKTAEAYKKWWQQVADKVAEMHPHDDETKRGLLVDKAIQKIMQYP